MSVETETVKVTIAVEGHTHAGKPCAKGDVLYVSPALAAWMAENKIIESKTAGKPAKSEG